MAHILYAKNKAEKPTLKQCIFKPVSISDDNEVVAPLSEMAQSFPTQQFSCNSFLKNQQYELLLINPPKVEPAELRQAVRWRIKDQLAYHVDDAVIDIFEIPGQQSASSKFLYAVSAQKRDVELRVETLHDAGFNVASIDIHELAQRNVAKLLEEDKDGIVFLRFTEDGGLLTITKNSVLYLARNIDFGAKRMKQALNTRSNAQATEEIELFLDDESSSSEEAISETENPAILNEQGKLILDEVILEIQRSLDYYVSHFNQRQVKKIVLGPLAQAVPGAKEYINDML